MFSVDPADEKAAKLAAKQGAALANGMDLTRDLGNLPGNVCTPTYLANTAKKLAKDWKLKVEVLGQKQIEALKMGSFLSVTKGSVEPPQFIVLQYQGARRRRPRRWCWSARASRSTPAAFRSSRAKAWTR